MTPTNEPQGEPQLPEEPTDRWGRFHRFTTTALRCAWVRPRHLTENHAAIEQLDPREAALLLDAWAADPSGRQGLEALHDAAFGPCADLDPNRRRELVLLAVRDGLASGSLVVHVERLRGGAPGTIPVQPSKPDRPPKSVGPVTTWIEIELIDENDAPVPAESVLVVEPSGATRRLTTGDKGIARLEGLEPGTCDVSFPRIDGREWARPGSKFPDGSDDVDRVHHAHADECMTRIAYAHHFRSPGTLYLHPCNAELRRLRPNPDLLWPHDRVKILVRDERVDAAATGQRHRYRVKAAARWLRVILHGFDRRPLASEEYVFRVDGRGPIARTTTERGLLEEPIPAWAVHATIETRQHLWQVAIAALVPTTRVPDEGHGGGRQRLSNLGFPARSTERRASTDEAAGEANADAFDVEVWRFQRLESLASTGVANEAVVRAAVKRHLV